MDKINKTDNLHNHHRLAPQLGTRHIVLQKDILMGQFQPALVYFRLFLISILKIQNEKSVDGVLLGFKPSAAIW